MDENGAWRELRRLSPAVPDARGDRGKRHKLSETLFLIVSGMPADCQDALDIVDFGRDHRDRLERFLELVHGIPSPGAWGAPGGRMDFPMGIRLSEAHL